MDVDIVSDATISFILDYLNATDHALARALAARFGDAATLPALGGAMKRLNIRAVAAAYPEQWEALLPDGPYHYARYTRVPSDAMQAAAALDAALDCFLSQCAAGDAPVQPLYLALAALRAREG